MADQWRSSRTDEDNDVPREDERVRGIADESDDEFEADDDRDDDQDDDQDDDETTF